MRNARASSRTLRGCNAIGVGHAGTHVWTPQGAQPSTIEHIEPTSNLSSPIGASHFHLTPSWWLTQERGHGCKASDFPKQAE
eukprot:6907897-Alexandrium_andersonii.AAC.1